MEETGGFEISYDPAIVGRIRRKDLDRKTARVAGYV